MSDDDDDLSDLLSYDPFSKENCCSHQSLDESIVKEPHDENDASEEASDALGECHYYFVYRILIWHTFTKF